MIFVDSNIFTRLFVKDGTGQHEKAKALFLLAQEGKAELVTEHPVLFELAWVLSYTYRLCQVLCVNSLMNNYTEYLDDRYCLSI
jgi:predicted nucleic acid-binding protein